MPTMSHHWITKEKIDLDKDLGFIYAIINKQTGQTYYGRKQFVKFRKRKRLRDDSWRFYKGSSRNVHDDIARYGLASFDFIIIATFRTKTGMALGESTAIICSGCLESPDKYYNRSAPSIRGSLKIDRDVVRGITKIRRFISRRGRELK